MRSGAGRLAEPAALSDIERQERVLLVGPMGVGKSTVAALLAARLGWTALDTDALIEASAGRGVAAIFADEGEAGFRRREFAVLQDVVARRAVVVATGGGALCSEAAWSLVDPGTLVVWLDAPVAVLVDRIGDTAGRPLLASASDPAAVLRALDERRRSWYARAHLHVETEGASPDQVAHIVASRIGRATEEAR